MMIRTGKEHIFQTKTKSGWRRHLASALTVCMIAALTPQAALAVGGGINGSDGSGVGAATSSNIVGESFDDTDLIDDTATASNSNYQGNIEDLLRSVPRPLAITIQPKLQTAAEGEEVTFALEASGKEMSYQWEKGEPPSDADHTFDRTTTAEERFRWSVIPGAEEASYTFTASLEDLFDNVYRCQVTAGNGEQKTSRLVWVSEPGNLGRSAAGGNITSTSTKEVIERIFGGAENVSVEMDAEGHDAKITLLQDVEAATPVTFVNGKYVLDVGAYDLTGQETTNGFNPIYIYTGGSLLLTGSGGAVAGGVGTGESSVSYGGSGIHCSGSLTLAGEVTVQGGHGTNGVAHGIYFDGKNLSVPEGTACRVLGGRSSDGRCGDGIYVAPSSGTSPKITIEDGYYEGWLGLSLTYSDASVTMDMTIKGGVFHAVGGGGGGLGFSSTSLVPDNLGLSISGGIFCAAEGETDSKAIVLHNFYGSKKLKPCIELLSYIQSLDAGNVGAEIVIGDNDTFLPGKIIVRNFEMFDARTDFVDGKFFLVFPKLKQGMYKVASDADWLDVPYTDLGEEGEVGVIPLKVLDSLYDGESGQSVFWLREGGWEIQGIPTPASLEEKQTRPRIGPPEVKSVTAASGNTAADGAAVVGGLTDELTKYQISRDEEIWTDAEVEKGTGDWRITGLAGGNYWLHVYSPETDALPGMSTPFTVPVLSSGDDQPGENPGGDDQPGENPGGDDQPGENPGGDDQPGENPGSDNQPGKNPDSSHTSAGNSSSDGSGSAVDVRSIETETHTTAMEDGRTLTTYTAVNPKTRASVTVQVIKDGAGNVILIQGEVRTQTPQVTRQGETTTIYMEVEETTVRAVETAVGMALNLNVKLPETEIVRQLQSPETRGLVVEITAPSALLGAAEGGSHLTGITISRETLEAVKSSGKSLTVRVKDETGAVRYEWTATEEELMKALQTGAGLTLPLPGAPSTPTAPSAPTVSVARPIQESEETGSKRYTVRPGDTVYKIAKQYGCGIEKIMELNYIPDVRDLRIGREIVIP